MDEDIDLKDYLRVIWKEKFLIIAVTMLVLITVVFFSYVMPSANEYQVDALLYVEDIPESLNNSKRYSGSVIVSSITSNDIIMGTVGLSGLADNEPFKSERWPEERAAQWLKENIEVKAKGNEIELILKGPVGPDTLQKTLQTYITVVTEENKKKLTQDANNDTRKVNMSVELLAAKLSDVFTSIEKIQEESPGNSTLNVELFMAFSRLGAIEDRLNILELQRMELEYIASPEFNWIEVISSAYGSEIPVGPNRTLNIIITCILGLFAGVFIAFFKDYIEDGSSK
jgi:uncharacterized protein involved in exopolysaccharide biosynthesis